MTFKINTYNVARLSFLSVLIFLLLIRIKLIFSYSVDLDGAEFGFIHYAQLLLQHKPLYPNPNVFPYLPILFTPGYPYLIAFLSNLFHFNYNNDIHQILVMARTLSFLFLFANAYFIFKIFKLFKLPFIYFLAAITFYLLLITGHFFATRPDALKTTAFTLFLYTVIQYSFFRSRLKYFLLSLFSGWLAVYLKQDAILNICLLLLLLCFYLNNKRTYFLALTFMVGLIISLAGCFFFFGDYFFTNILLFNFQAITEMKISINVLLVLFSGGRLSFLIIIACYSCYWYRKTNQNKSPQYFIAIASVVFFVTTHLSMTKAGSNLNYSYDDILLLLITAALILYAKESLIINRTKIFQGIAAFYVLLLFLSNSKIHTYAYHPQKEKQYKEDYFSILHERDSILAITQHKIFFLLNAQNIIFFANDSIICGYDFHLDRLLEIPEQYRWKSKLLFASSEPYDSYFKDGTVNYIVARNDKNTPKDILNYYPHYSIYKTLEYFVIYKFDK